MPMTMRGPSLYFFLAAPLLVTSWGSVVDMMLTSALLGLAALVLTAALAILVWLVLSMRNEVRSLGSLRGLEKAGQENPKEIASVLDKLIARVDSLEQIVGGLTQRREKSDATAREVPGAETREDMAGHLASPSAIAAAHSGVGADNVGVFPRSVREYLGDLRDRGIPIRYVELKNLRADILTEDPKGGLVLVNTGGEGVFQLVPAFDRLLTGNEIRTYSEFFVCEKPSPGDVWIDTPAIAVCHTAEGEWRIDRKGVLEIR